MALKLLEAFVQIFADKSAFEKTVAGLPSQMQSAGKQAGVAYRQAFESVTPQRAVGAGVGPSGSGPIQVGGISVSPDVSLFSRQGQLAARATELAAASQAGGADAEKAAASATRAGSAFTAARQSARVFGATVGSELNPALGEFVSATTSGAQSLGHMGTRFAILGGGIGAVLAVFGAYIGRLKEATDLQVKLTQAQRDADPAKAEAGVKTAIDVLDKFNQLQKEVAAGPGRIGGPPPFQAFFANIQLLFGKGKKDLEKDLTDFQKIAAEKFKDLGIPKIAQQSIIDTQQLVQKSIALDRQAAESASDVASQTDRLVKSKREQAEATAKLIELEEKQLQATIDSGELRDADVIATKRADIARRANDVRRANQIEEQQILRDAARAAAEFRAKEEEAAGRELAFRRRRVDAIISAAKDIVEIEAQTNLSLQQALRARTQLQEASTEQQIRAIREEADARRAAIGARLQGATGDERVQLERELTEVTKEEATKRFEIETQAATQRAQLAARERQERIGQAEQIFSIQKTLNDRRLSEELATQKQIAQAAREGSNIQIAAIQKVAEIQAQIQQQARSVIQQALTVAQQQAQRLGIEGPTFVSQASIQRDLERQQARDAAVRERFQRGLSVRSDELQGALGNQPFFEQFKGLGGQLGDVFKQAVTPLKEAFESTLGPAVTEQFTNLASKAKESFADLVTAATPAFQSIEKLVSDTFDRINEKVNQGNSNIVTSITRMVEDNLVRALRDAERRA